MKNAITAIAAIGEGLRIIFESIGRSFGSGVIDGEKLILLHQHKFHVRAGAFDRSRLHITRYAQALGVGAVAHLVELADGDVIAFAVLDTGVGEIAEQKKDYDRGAAELQIGFCLTGHETPHARPDTLKTLPCHRRRIKVPNDGANHRATILELCRHESAPKARRSWNHHDASNPSAGRREPCDSSE